MQVASDDYASSTNEINLPSLKKKILSLGSLLFIQVKITETIVMKRMTIESFCTYYFFSPSKEYTKQIKISLVQLEIPCEKDSVMV